MSDREKVEFIESYIKVQGGDYQWNDNHGELVRCMDCKHYFFGECENDYVLRRISDCGSKPCFHVDPEWFCGDGERR